MIPVYQVMWVGETVKFIFVVNRRQECFISNILITMLPGELAWTLPSIDPLVMSTARINWKMGKKCRLSLCLSLLPRNLELLFQFEWNCISLQFYEYKPDKQSHKDYPIL